MQVLCALNHLFSSKNWCFLLKTAETGQFYGLPSLKTDGSPRPNSSATLPIEDHPLGARREPSALEGCTLGVLCCDPKGIMAFLWILSTEGRGGCLWWAHSKRKGPKGSKVTFYDLCNFFEKLLVENFCMQCSVVVGIVKLSIFSQRRVSRRAVERCAKPDAMGLGES